MGDGLEASARRKLDEKSTPTKDEITSAADAVEQAFRDKVAENEPPWPEESYTWIKPYVEFFCDPDPSVVSGMATSLGEVRDNLTSGQVTAVTGVEATVEDWEGDARDSFWENFLVPFPKAVENQTEVVDELRCAVWGFESIVRSGRRDVKKILDKTKECVDGYDGDKTAKASFGLSIVIAVTGVLAALPTGGATLGLALVSSGAVGANAVIAADAAIDGNTLGEIMMSMQHKLEDVRKEMDNQEKALADALKDSNTKVNEILDSSDPVTLMKLLPNTGHDSRRMWMGGMEVTPVDNDDRPDVTDGKDDDTDEFRPPS